MVVGSFASSFHGMPRSSQDLDLVIDPDPRALNRFLADLAYIEGWVVELDLGDLWSKIRGR